MSEEYHSISMKPLMSLAIQEAVKLAIIDSLPPPESEHGVREDWTDEQRRDWLWNIHSIPEDAWARIDPGALARNVCIRLMGRGGWTVRGVYAGNATPREILEACIERPDEDPLGDIKMDLGLREP